ncbi:uridine kinase family protein [Arsenicicoccus piscis]|uniref:uridine kinase family protein n=1 Tax=Arsenicicoccus piscis TaxID=673954 RepID=UPI0024E06A9A|nr:AAA family ATPase [Arsenicicoccus piscis]
MPPNDSPRSSTRSARSRPREGAAARVVVVCGPSGAGKSRLCERLTQRHGWPIVRLDDFYLDGDDPRLPIGQLGIPDWDDPASWDLVGAVAVLAELVHTGSARLPVYDISASRRVGEHELQARPTDYVLAEGIFAAEAIAVLRQEGLLADAWCVCRDPRLTFWLRLARDLREHRKPPLTLWRRGLLLKRQEPEVIARQRRLGATPLTPRRAESRAEALARR